jgi:endogenous inhibitor of DNA gyrase (YacG/DUF329 family)
VGGIVEEALRCPICAHALGEGTGARRYFPFCSERCRLIDLGKWVTEEYRVSEPLLPRPEETEEP